MSGLPFRYVWLRMNIILYQYVQIPKHIDNYTHKKNIIFYRATEQEMKDFFLPVQCQSIKVLLNRDLRPSGEAIASFEDEEALKQAMTKDREHLGSRFVILRRYEERWKNDYVKMNDTNIKANIFGFPL